MEPSSDRSVNYTSGVEGERLPHVKGVAMSGVDRSQRIARLKRVLWFVLLWLLGVGGAALLTLPFHLLVVSATRT